MFKIARRFAHPAASIPKIVGRRSMTAPAVYEFEQPSLPKTPVNHVMNRWGQSLHKTRLTFLTAYYKNACSCLFKMGLDATNLRDLQMEVLQIASASAKKRPIFRDPNSQFGEYRLSKDFVAFCESEGIYLDSSLQYKPSTMSKQNSIDVQKAVVKFGKRICDDHPVVFWDVYLGFSKNLAVFFRELEIIALNYVNEDEPQTDDALGKRLAGFEKEYGPEFPVKWCRKIIQWLNQREAQVAFYAFHSRTLMDQLTAAPQADWYMYHHFCTTGLPWTMVRYLRMLPQTPFDPLHHTDYIDPKQAQAVYEQVGLCAASLPGQEIEIEWIPECLDYDSRQDKRFKAYW